MPRRTAANNVFQADVFRAIAQRPRRQIIEILARRRELAVGALVLALGCRSRRFRNTWAHCRAAGIVSVSKQGQQRMYAMNYDQLRPVYDWIKLFEQHWQRQLDRIAVRANRGQPPSQTISKTVPSENPQIRKGHHERDHSRTTIRRDVRDSRSRSTSRRRSRSPSKRCSKRSVPSRK